MSDLIETARQQINRYGHVSKPTSLALCNEIERLQRTSEYWKAEHLAGNDEIERLQAREVNWSHPKAQAMLSSKARDELVIAIAEDLLDKPDDRSATDFDYEHPIHDKILLLKRQRDDLLAYWEWARTTDKYHFEIENPETAKRIRGME